MSFAASARRLAAAAQLMGWTPDTFWTATPADLANALGAPGEDEAADPETVERLKRMIEEERGRHG